MPPVACGAIPQQTVTVGEQVQIEPCFEDPEMGALTLAAVSSNPEVATSEVLRGKVRIVAVSPGTAVITVTATDPDGLAGELSFEALVPNRAPQLLKGLPPGRIYLPQLAPIRLVLSKYFTDPDGQSLTYGATSSDARLASVAVSADTLAVNGGAPGRVTVTITATDPGGLSATAEMEVTVLNNQRPVVVRKLQPVISFPAGRGWSLKPYFSDPDGDILTYSVASSNPSVVEAFLVGFDSAQIWLSLSNVGAATVSVTATDPPGTSVTAEFEVRVVEKRLPFRDDFESATRLDYEWVPWDASTAELAEGMVRVTHLNRPRTLFSALLRPVLAHDWTVSARMGNVTENSWVQLRVNLSPRDYRPARSLHLQVGADPEHHWTEDDTNWRLLAYNEDYSFEVVASGESEAVGGLGELVDVTLSHVGRTLSVVIGDSVVFSSRGFGDPSRYFVWNLFLGVWPADHGSTVPRTGVFDWVEVNGVLASPREIGEARAAPPPSQGWPGPREPALESPQAFLEPDDEDPLTPPGAAMAARGPVPYARAELFGPARGLWLGTRVRWLALEGTYGHDGPGLSAKGAFQW